MDEQELARFREREKQIMEEGKARFGASWNDRITAIAKRKPSDEMVVGTIMGDRAIEEIDVVGRAFMAQDADAVVQVNGVNTTKDYDPEAERAWSRMREQQRSEHRKLRGR